MLWGRGFRWMYYATGMPGWMRVGFGYPVFGRGNSLGFCRWFPWMPRLWWTGIHEPVKGMPQGLIQFRPKMTKEQEIQFLEQQIKAIEEERKILDQDLEAIRKRLYELKKQK